MKDNNNMQLIYFCKKEYIVKTFINKLNTNSDGHYTYKKYKIINDISLLLITTEE